METLQIVTSTRPATDTHQIEDFYRQYGISRPNSTIERHEETEKQDFCMTIRATTTTKEID